MINVFDGKRRAQVCVFDVAVEGFQKLFFPSYQFFVRILPIMKNGNNSNDATFSMEFKNDTKRENTNNSFTHMVFPYGELFRRICN